MSEANDFEFADTLRESVFGVGKGTVLEACDGGSNIAVREYQLLLLQRAIEENVRLSLLYACWMVATPRLCRSGSMRGRRLAEFAMEIINSHQA
jgi:hypothetical protein